MEERSREIETGQFLTEQQRPAYEIGGLASEAIDGTQKANDPWRMLAPHPRQ